MKNKVEIVGHSVDPRGNELLSVLVTFPRIILAEVNTHRMLSKNTSSSRAIPFNKMVQSIMENPFTPIAWQKSHSGMQGSEYFSSKEVERLESEWLLSRDRAVESAVKMKHASLNNELLTKQLCNRLLEPFMWTTMLITGSKEGWDNFFELRCNSYILEEYNEYDEVISTNILKSRKEIISKYPNWYIRKDDQKRFGKFTKDMTDLEWLQFGEGQAEIHIMDLAEKIYDALNESTPKKLKPGEYHIPFEDKITGPFTYEVDGKKWVLSKDMLENEIAANEIIIDGETVKSIILNQMVRISTSMAARTSYTLIEGTETSNEKHLALYHRLIAQNPPHSSPMEHCARAMDDEEYVSWIKGQPDMIDYEKEEIAISYLKTYEDSPEAGWCRNFKGFIPLRHLVESGDKKFN